RTLFHKACLALLSRQEVGKLLVQFLEQGNITVELIQNTQDDAVHLLVQFVALLLGDIAPADTGFGQAVEQPARRMCGLAEKVLVLDHHLENGNLQAANQDLNGGRQVVVVQNEVE